MLKQLLSLISMSFRCYWKLSILSISQTKICTKYRICNIKCCFTLDRLLDIAQFETLSHTVDKNCFKLCWYHLWEESPESCNPFDIRNHSTSNKIEVVCLLSKFSLCFSVYYSSHFMFISFNCYWYGAVSIEIENIWFEYMNGSMLNNGFQCSVRRACVCACV